MMPSLVLVVYTSLTINLEDLTIVIRYEMDVIMLRKKRSL